MIVYEAYNKNNGKVYIGLTVNSLEVRKGQHLRSAKSGKDSYFNRALRKHGEESFEWSVIFICSSLEDMYRLEQLAISLHEDCQTYNVSKGGEHPAYGMKHSDEVKRICGEYSKKRWDGKRAVDVYPSFVFKLPTYKEAKEYGIPKTTYYRNRDLT